TAWTYLNDYEQALNYGQASLKHYEALHDQWGMTAAYHAVGYIHQRQGDFSTAQRVYRQCMALAHAVEDQRSLTLSLISLGRMTYTLGDYGGARTLIEEGLKLARQIHYPRGVAMALYDLGLVIEWGWHDLERATALFLEALTVQRQIGDQSGVGFTLNQLGDLAYQMGDYGKAQLYYTDSLSIKQTVHDEWGTALVLGGLGEVMGATRQVESAFHYFRAATQLAYRINAMTLLMGIFHSMIPPLLRLEQHDEAGMLVLIAVHHPQTAPHYHQLALQLLREPSLSDWEPMLREDATTAGAYLIAHLPQLAPITGLSVEMLAEVVTAFYHPDTPPRTAPGLIEALTAREVEILRLLAKGLSNNEIAERLVIGTATVKTHTLNIYRKLDVSNRTQAITRAQALGLI
ncbi:partial Transcriptional regulatory protein LiaR, partial [Anaerolineae bacterium]